MRIAFDHQIFGWHEYGGVSRYLYELARELATTYRQDVSVVSPLYVNHYVKQAPKELKVLGTPISRIPKTRRIVRIANSVFARPMLRWLAPDIVHETYYSFTRFAPKGAKLILTVHDMIHERIPASFSVTDLTRQKKMLSVARADHVICVSRQTQQDLVEMMGVDPDKTSVVYHGSTLSYDQVEICEAINGRPYLLYVGNRGGYKNFDGFLRAVALSALLRKDYRIVCFGGGGLTPRERVLVAELGFSGRDVCQVSGSDAVLAGLYQHARAFVYPSLYEGFGMPPLEAMGFSCPVACSGVSSIPEVVGDAGAYFDPRNVHDMRIVIERLVSDNVHRELLVAAGQARVNNFSWERCAAETLEVYRKVWK